MALAETIAVKGEFTSKEFSLSARGEHNACHEKQLSFHLICSVPHESPIHHPHSSIPHLRQIIESNIHGSGFQKKVLGLLGNTKPLMKTDTKDSVAQTVNKQDVATTRRSSATSFTAYTNIGP